MKGKEEVIIILNDLLSDELTAINQYTVHAEMCENWKYERLHEYIEHRSIKEMEHASALIQRILFLGGTPVVSRYKEIMIGADVSAQLVNDHKAEKGAIASYSNAIKTCYDLNDHGTRKILECFLKEEEEHIDWIEAQIDQINQMGIENYLSTQNQK